jgi:hypothetical protein
MAVPTTGSVTVQLVVTDSRGDSDSAYVTLAQGSSVYEFPPPAAEVHRGGGGVDSALLVVLGLLLAARLAQQRRGIMKRS